MAKNAFAGMVRQGDVLQVSSGPRKPKTYQTSHGYYDLAIAARESEREKLKDALRLARE